LIVMLLKMGEGPSSNGVAESQKSRVLIQVKVVKSKGKKRKERTNLVVTGVTWDRNRAKNQGVDISK